MMQCYWLRLDDGMEVHCEGQNANDAALIVHHRTGHHVKDRKAHMYSQEDNPNIQFIPYPNGKDLVWQFAHPVHGVTPTFCHRGYMCHGKSACPGNPACTE